LVETWQTIQKKFQEGKPQEKSIKILTCVYKQSVTI